MYIQKQTSYLPILKVRKKQKKQQEASLRNAKINGVIIQPRRVKVKGWSTFMSTKEINSYVYLRMSADNGQVHNDAVTHECIVVIK